MVSDRCRSCSNCFAFVHTPFARRRRFLKQSGGIWGEVLADAPPEGHREAVQARALLEKAERIQAKANPSDREELDQFMNAVRTSLSERDWPGLEKACNALSDVLFYLEDA